MSNLTSPHTEVQKTKKKSLTADKKPRSTDDIVRSYLQEIGRVDLLTREQEVIFAQQVQQMMNLLAAKDELAVKLNHEPTLQEWADRVELTVEVLEQQLNLGHQAKQKMIQANLRLVVAVAKKYQHRNLEFMDLIQEGTLGLERGVDKFDPALGYKFSTYAYWWIRQGITRAIAQQGRTIRLPIHVFEKLNKIKRVQRELSQQLGRVPTTGEIATALSLTASQVRECLYLARQPFSLEARVGEQQDTELQDILEDDGPSPEDYAVEESLHQDLQDLLAKLSPQQREILTLRFGLTDGYELSLAQIGDRMGISRERVRQIEQKALSLLRRQKEQVRSYLAS
ncbi:MAG: RpoD/SigA family RNA polymerase sigma factor [Nostoc sp. DedSLP03]|uniref:RpoD/SigA family RNA polymerase sigma factor n=1 Tax=Nostoc sp. DedSLP03 TaxID=3075400 RepID=UPI002AD54110|nr:RpoD/SigA family RNA polymerase sigma factor [Nostoc sp. DedSLP03]MDZ7970380.1 RpoD/SigA family RNA polymerase sigma factor [Nostoc sp. DedSLP03]